MIVFQVLKSNWSLRLKKIDIHQCSDVENADVHMWKCEYSKMSFDASVSLLKVSFNPNTTETEGDSDGSSLKGK